MGYLLLLALCVLLAAGFVNEATLNFKLLKQNWRLGEEKEKLEELVVHTWVHSAYPNCGYREMTSEQKALFDRITKRDAE